MNRHNAIVAVLIAAACALCVFCCCATGRAPAEPVQEAMEPAEPTVTAAEPESEPVAEPEPEPEPEPKAKGPVTLRALYYCHACGEWTATATPLYASDELIAFLCDGCLDELRDALEARPWNT